MTEGNSIVTIGEDDPITLYVDEIYPEGKVCGNNFPCCKGYEVTTAEREKLQTLLAAQDALKKLLRELRARPALEWDFNKSKWVDYD